MRGVLVSQVTVFNILNENIAYIFVQNLARGWIIFIKKQDHRKEKIFNIKSYVYFKCFDAKITDFFLKNGVN